MTETNLVRRWEIVLTCNIAIESSPIFVGTLMGALAHVGNMIKDWSKKSPKAFKIHITCEPL